MRSIILCEKSSQAGNIKMAVGDRYGPVLAASGHLYALAVPDHYKPEWASWQSYAVYRPTVWIKLPTPGNDPADDKRLNGLRQAIRAGLATADRVYIATDADREGEVIGRELLEAHDYQGEAFRILFASEDPASIIEAFTRPIPFPEREAIYRAGLARERADFIWNFSLTRAATVALTSADQTSAIGIGRVKTPTLGIICRREIAVTTWKPSETQIIRIEIETPAGKVSLATDADQAYPSAEAANAALASGKNLASLTIAAKTERKRQAPPRPPDLTVLQVAASKWGWTAEKTLATGQSLYSGYKIITYIRASARAYPDAMIAAIGPIMAALQSAGFGPLPSNPVIRRDKRGTFSNAALEGESHHAIAPNHKTADQLATILPQLSADELRLFELIAQLFIECLSPDQEYDSTALTARFDDKPLTGTVIQTISAGWRAVRKPETNEASNEDAATELSSAIQAGDYPITAMTASPAKAKGPSRLNHGSLISAMATAWSYVQDEQRRARLKEAKGIGTVATRDQIIKGLIEQKQITESKNHLVPTKSGFDLFTLLYRLDPRLVDPGTTAEWELQIDEIARGNLALEAFLDGIEAETSLLIAKIRAETPKLAFGASKPPTSGMIKAVEAIQRAKKLAAPTGWRASYAVAAEFLTANATKKA